MNGRTNKNKKDFRGIDGDQTVEKVYNTIAIRIVIVDYYL